MHKIVYMQGSDRELGRGRVEGHVGTFGRRLSLQTEAWLKTPTGRHAILALVNKRAPNDGGGA